MTIDLLHRLLAQGESSHLDYKSKQYRFAGASDGENAEMLKDILAMGNALRDTNAYILSGVKEEPGRKALVVGITEHVPLHRCTTIRCTTILTGLGCYASIRPSTGRRTSLGDAATHSSSPKFSGISAR